MLIKSRIIFLGGVLFFKNVNCSDFSFKEKDPAHHKTFNVIVDIFAVSGTDLSSPLDVSSRSKQGLLLSVPNIGYPGVRPNSLLQSPWGEFILKKHIHKTETAVLLENLIGRHIILETYGSSPYYTFYVVKKTADTDVDSYIWVPILAFRDGTLREEKRELMMIKDDFKKRQTALLARWSPARCAWLGCVVRANLFRNHSTSA